MPKGLHAALVHLTQSQMMSSAGGEGGGEGEEEPELVAAFEGKPKRRRSKGGGGPRPEKVEEVGASEGAEGGRAEKRPWERGADERRRPTQRPKQAARPNNP